MAKAGADIVGANCLFDPWIGLETVGKMNINQNLSHLDQPDLISFSAEEDEGCVGCFQHVPPPDDATQCLPLPRLWPFWLAVPTRVSIW